MFIDLSIVFNKHVVRVAKILINTIMMILHANPIKSYDYIYVKIFVEIRHLN